MTRRCSAVVLALAVALGTAACQETPTPGTPGTPATPTPQQQGADLAAQMRAQFDKEGIRVDLAAGTVTIKATAVEPPDPIEYLLIHRRGKKHEAMFATDTRPSVLNGALLLLGLEPGKNATYREKDPPPTLDEIEKGADPVIVTPPEGMQFWMTVHWKDAADQSVDCCVEDLIGDLTTQEAVRDASWIFLGGRMASLYKNEPEVFVADFEGNLVSVCYLTPDNHLGTMRHERGRDDQNWWMTRLMPPRGTEVEFTFHRHESALHVARAQRLQQEDAARAAESPAGAGDDKGGGR